MVLNLLLLPGNTVVAVLFFFPLFLMERNAGYITLALYLFLYHTPIKLEDGGVLY